MAKYNKRFNWRSPRYRHYPNIISHTADTIYEGSNVFYVPVFVTMFDTEKFYKIPYSDISGYALSESGRCISNKSGVWKEMKLSKCNGYLMVTFTTNTPGRKYTIYIAAIQKTYTIHKLLYSTFKSGTNHSKDIVVDHIDTNKSNNALSNLRLLDRYDNLFNHRKNKPKYIVYSNHAKEKTIDKAKITRVNMHVRLYEKLFDTSIRRARQKEAKRIEKVIERIDKHREVFERQFIKAFKRIRLDKKSDLPILRPIEFKQRYPEYLALREACEVYGNLHKITNMDRVSNILKELVNQEQIISHVIGKRYFILKTDIK